MSAAAAERPAAIDFGNIPRELRDLDQWVLWRREHRKGDPKGKLTKVPYQVNGRKASSTDPSTWSGYEAAVDALAGDGSGGSGFDGVGLAAAPGGIGFVFSPTDPYFGVDLDGAVEPETGELKPWAREIVARFEGCHIERSPSGTGIHIIGRGKLPGGGRKATLEDGAIEVYDRGRFFTMTGDVVQGRLL